MMNVLHLEIVCPDGELFSGEAKSILVTTDDGEMQILRGHADIVATLKTGRAKLTLPDGSERLASASGGFIIVKDGSAKVVATTFEFKDTIDLERARLAKEAAEEKIKHAKDEREFEIAKAKLERALSRISVASGK